MCVRETVPVLDTATILPALERACADAGLDAATVVAWLVEAERPPGTTPLAYLQPAGSVRPDTVLVFRAVGEERAAAHHMRAHRLALWAGLPGIPAHALGPMLRHELEHARRWERSGPRFFEADDLLRTAVRDAGGAAYASLPSELEANAASAAYAARTLTRRELAELAEAGELQWLLAADPPPADVVEATLVALAAHGAAPAAYLEEVRTACAAWPAVALPAEGLRIEVVNPRS